MKKGKEPVRPAPPQGCVKAECGGFFRCRGRGGEVPFLFFFFFSPLSLFVLPDNAVRAALSRRAGRQHLHGAPAPTLAARPSEKPGRPGAKLFSKSDPYLGAFQEAGGLWKSGSERARLQPALGEAGARAAR